MNAKGKINVAEGILGVAVLLAAPFALVVFLNGAFDVFFRSGVWSR